MSSHDTADAGVGPTAEASVIPVESLRAVAIRPAERFDAWAAAVNKVVSVSPLGEESQKTGTSFTAWRLDNIVLSEASYCALSPVGIHETG